MNPHTRMPHLRLVYPDDDLDGQPLLSAGMTLSQFFHAWYLEHVLRSQEAKPGTIKLCKDALAWWQKLTGDPPIERISQAVVNQFRDELRQATYRRGMGMLRRLGAQSVAKHLATIRTLLKACGPQTRADRPAAALIDKTPLVSCRRPKLTPKECFSIEQLKLLIEACALLDGWAADGVPMRRWMPAAYCVYFYTGVRKSTGLALRWTWLKQKRNTWLLDIPDEAVPKTDKGKVTVAHATLIACCERIRSGDLLLPWDHSSDYVLDVHYRVQTLAGIPDAEQLDLHALRRTFDNEMLLLGAEVGVKIAKEALDHADERTTLGSYVTVNRLIPRLPAIWSPDDSVHQKRLF